MHHNEGGIHLAGKTVGTCLHLTWMGWFHPAAGAGIVLLFLSITNGWITQSPQIPHHPYAGISSSLMDQSSKDFHCSCICCCAYSTYLCNIEVFLITTLANCGFVRSTDRIQHICQGHLHNFCCNCSLYGQVHLFLCRILTAVVWITPCSIASLLCRLFTTAASIPVNIWGSCSDEMATS